MIANVKDPSTLTEYEVLMRLLRHRTRGMYDIQKMRIQFSNRESSVTALLTEEDKEFFKENSAMLEAAEKHILRDLKRRLDSVPIAVWIMEQRGINATMAAVLVSYFNIEMCTTVSKMWRWAGLAVLPGTTECTYCKGAKTVTLFNGDVETCRPCGGMGTFGEAERLRKGERAHYDPWLKSKVVAVLGGNLIKCVGLDPGGYYTSANFPNPHYVAEEKKPVAPKKKPGRKPKKPIEEPTVENVLAQQDEPEESPEDLKYFLRLSEDREPSVEELKDVGAPAWKKTVQVRRPFSGKRPDPGTGKIVNLPWRAFYDNYKHRKESQRIPICMGCNGTGMFKLNKKELDRLEFLSTLPTERLRNEEVGELLELQGIHAGRGGGCTNCRGTGRNAPWGRSPAHRHMAAQRYMVKMFLMALWEKWRTLEGLSIREPYAKEYLGIEHHD
jgi:hypothetical protein